MNCSVCGKPLLFNRVAFKCSCGAYVHAYCLDQHILEAHRPEVEEGYVDLNSDFHPIKAAEPEAEMAEGAELPEEAETLEGVSEESAEEGGIEEGESKGVETESEEDFSPGELVEDQVEEAETENAAAEDEN